MSTATLQAMQAAPALEQEAAFERDFWLLSAVATLLLFGLVMVYSATVMVNDDGIAGFGYLIRHGINLFLSAALMWGVSRLSLSWWQALSRPLLVFAFVLLILVLIPGIGVEVNGSRRWLPLGLMRLQPSELAKLMVVVYFADYFCRKRDELQHFKVGVGVALGILALLTLLMLMEPDLGSTVVMLAAVMTMMFLAGVKVLHLLGIASTGVITVVALTLTSPYRMERVTSFLKPFDDPFNSGFQLVQALIAFGRGEWFGVGLGSSIQKLYYLPHANTDFILAVVGEELGLLGVLGVTTLFCIVLWRTFTIAQRSARIGQLFGAHLARGLGLVLGFQALINIGVNLGVLPTKGLTLPFMSYGGSSLLVSCMAIGLILRVDRESRPQPGADR